MKLLINIPAYNEEEKIKQTITSLPKKIKGIKKIKYQVIDDGSRDKTKQIAKDLKVHYVYSNRINRGLGLTFRKAVLKAIENDFHIMINIDADGQFNPDDIEKLIKPILKKEADIVIASRFSGIEPKNMPKIKYFLNILGAKIVGLFLNYKIDDLTCGFRAYNQESLMRLNLNHQFTYTQETIVDAISKNLKVIWHPVKVTYFKDRKAKMTKSITTFIFQSLMIIFKTIRDTKPLKFFALPAIFMIGFSAIIYLYFFISYLYNYYAHGVLKISPYQNWILLASIILILGIQFLVFAFLADMTRSNRKLLEDELYEDRKFRKNYNQKK
jgi:glycosyltransferase involved in cell wall biosynthesis